METNYVFSDTETTGLHETDFIQIIQSAQANKKLLIPVVEYKNLKNVLGKSHE